MVRRRKASPRRKANVRNQRSSAEHCITSQHSGAPERSLLKDILFGLAVCVTFFFCLEMALRIAGIPGRDPAEDPFVGFSAVQPLFDVKDGVASTAQSRIRHFNEQGFPVKKGPRTFRVFCFGGSTTYGHPFDWRTAFPRWLGELLKESCPGMDFEVINAGGISYASYRIVPLVKECLGYQPDLMVVLTGHNEFLERRTYSGLFERGRSLITVSSLLDRLYLYRGLSRVFQKLLPGLMKETSAGDSSPASHRKTVLKGEVDAILDKSAGLDLYHRDEAFYRGVVEHFAHNLRSMIKLCKGSRAPVILITPESNIKDFSPFKSEHESALNSARKSELDGELKSAAQLINDSRFEDALRSIDKVLAQDGAYAYAHFLKGQALLGMGRSKEALESFVRARDDDVCPLRAVSPILDATRKIAADEGASLIEFMDLLSARQPNGKESIFIPGNESFLDHVHPTIRGHQMIAEAIVDLMAQKGLVTVPRKLGEDARKNIYARVMNGLDPKFFALKDYNLAKVLKWAGKREEAKAALMRAADAFDENPEIHKMLGSFLLDGGDYEKAVAEYEKAVRMSGDDPDMVHALGVAQYRAGLVDKAQSTYERLVRAGTMLPEAYSNLAMIYLGKGRTEDARAVLKQGLDKNGDTPILLGPYGLSLALSGKPAEGIPWVLRALEQEPADTSNLYNLAGMYALCGKRKEALDRLEEAVAKGYSNYDKLATDDVFKTLRGEPRFRDILNRIR